MPDTNTNVKLDIRCVQCGYDLRGITQPVCPECGRDYKSLKAMKAECDTTARSRSWSRLATHCTCLIAAISNGMGTALVMGHYWLACSGYPFPPDPKSIGLFRLPGIGGHLQSLGFLTFIITPIVTVFGLMAFVAAFNLSRESGNRYRLKLSDWFSLVIILVSCGLFVIGMEQGVIKWLFD